MDPGASERSEELLEVVFEATERLVAVTHPVPVDIQAIIDERDWREVTLVAKSVGTMIIGFVGTTLSLPDKVNALWLTPTFTHDYTRDGAISAGLFL